MVIAVQFVEKVKVCAVMFDHFDHIIQILADKNERKK